MKTSLALLSLVLSSSVFAATNPRLECLDYKNRVVEAEQPVEQKTKEIFASARLVEDGNQVEVISYGGHYASGIHFKGDSIVDEFGTVFTDVTGSNLVKISRLYDLAGNLLNLTVLTEPKALGGPFTPEALTEEFSLNGPTVEVSGQEIIITPTSFSQYCKANPRWVAVIFGVTDTIDFDTAKVMTKAEVQKAFADMGMDGAKVGKVMPTMEPSRLRIVFAK